MDRQKFIETIQNSKILFDEEKQSIIDAAELFPDSEMIKIYSILEGYTAQDQAKKTDVVSQLDAMQAEYDKGIDEIEGLADDKKSLYHQKGAILMKALRKLVEII